MPAGVALGALVTLLAAPACRIEPDYAGTAYQCPDGVCPPGFHCVSQRCVPDNGDGGTQPACGSTALLHEEFASGSLPSWAESSAEAGGSVAFENDHAVLRLPDDPSGSATANLSSVWRYDLRNDSLTIEIAEMLNTDEPAAATFLFHDTWGDYAEFLQQQGMLAFNLWIDDTRLSNTMVDYDPTAHRWWRYREADGTLYWDTSPDGVNWTTRSSVTTPYFARRARVFFNAEAYSGASAPGDYAIESVNGGEPVPSWCPAESFSDDFEDGDLGLDWDPFEDSCALTQPAGRVRMTPDIDTTSTCGAGSTVLYDLRDSAAFIEVPVMVETTSDAMVYLRVGTEDAAIDLAQQGGNLEARTCTTDCTAHESVPYDATAQRWWRIREQAGTVYWETSPDGANWNPLASLATPLDAAAVFVNFGVTVQSPESSFGAAEFDNYNVAP